MGLFAQGACEQTADHGGDICTGKLFRHFCISDSRNCVHGPVFYAVPGTDEEGAGGVTAI